MQRMVSRFLGLCLAAGLATGCAAQRVYAEKALATAFISDEQEEKLGRQVKAELEQKEKIKYVEDAAVVDYVRNVSTRMLQVANRDRAGVKWKIHVIDDPKTVNAFATPGGYLYVYTGLLLAAETEAELAGVMAHEAGHVVGRHSARAMVQAYGLEAVTAAALGKDAGTVGKMASELVGGGLQLAHGRSQETEADEYGARYTSAVNYDPRGLVSFFEKLQKQEGKAPEALKWLSTHPPSAERAAHLTQFIQQNGLKGTEVGADRLATIKQRLRK
jgi:predicted Zn-dependent protease